MNGGPFSSTDTPVVDFMSPPAIGEPDGPLSPIIILGMHRSGTSYLASVVGAIGVNIGTSLLEAAPDNPRGYFEDRDFVEFQAGVLTRVVPEQGAGSPLGNILVRHVDRIELTPEEREHAVRLTADREGQSVWGWKDPRTCLLLDYWLERYPGATLIAAYRHPLEVYASIIRRQKLQVIGDESLIIDTWTAYNSAIARVWAGHRGRKFLIGTGEVFGDPATLAEAIRSRLGLPMPGPADHLPSFEAAEFTRLPVDRGAHTCFSAAFPEAGRVFDGLQGLADIPLAFTEADAPIWTPLRRWISSIPGAARLSLPIIVNLVSPELGILRAELFRSAVATAIETSRANVEIMRNFEIPQSAHLKQQQIAAQNSAELTEWRANHLVSRLNLREGARPIFIWGKNSLGQRVAELLSARGLAPAGTIDRSGAGGSMTPQEFFANGELSNADRVCVLICSKSAQTEICAQLAAFGLRREEDFFALPDTITETFHES